MPTTPAYIIMVSLLIPALVKLGVKGVIRGFDVDTSHFTGNFRQFECINCHEHNRTDMDDKHKEEQGYQYLSTACLGCHPRGD